MIIHEVLPSENVIARSSNDEAITKRGAKPRLLRSVYPEQGRRTRNDFKRVFGQSVNLSMQEYIVLFFLFYILVSLAGIFVLPRIFSAEFLVRLIKAVNFFETNGRDNLFFHLVKPLVRLGVHPNVITGIGFLLVGMLATSFWRPISPASFFVIALFAGLSDMFDGMLARASGKITSLGGALDGIRDFFLFSVLTIAAINKDYLPIKYILPDYQLLERANRIFMMFLKK